MRTLLIACGIIIYLAAAVRCAPAPAATIGEAQAAFDAGDYRGSLAKISSGLSTGAKPSPKERYDLLMLRGECMLKLKQSAGAVAAFEAAAKGLKTQGDVKSVAAATALAVLTKASPGLVYKGKSAGDQALDITDPQQRKRAMISLFEARTAIVMPSIDKALAGNTLPPIQKLLPAVWELYALEFGATSDAVETVGTIKKIGGHARGLIEKELVQLCSRLDQLNDLANEPSLSSNVGVQTMSFRGLNSHERDELKKLADYLVNIQQVVEQGRRINRLFGGTGEPWDALLADCAEAREDAQQAYDRRY